MMDNSGIMKGKTDEKEATTVNVTTEKRRAKEDRIWYAVTPVLFAAFVIGTVVFLISCIENFPMEITNREDALKMFRKNETVFLTAAETGDFAPVEKLRGVQSTDADEDIAVIKLGGYGLGPETGYFYIVWLKDGLNTGPDSRWEPYGNGWVEHGEGDNIFYAESLGNGFYYHEAHY